jgi:hypothetical protein
MVKTFSLTIILTCLIGYSSCVYEDIFCDSCPLTIGNATYACTTPLYTCSCVCSGGCNTNSNNLVSRGATITLSNIKSIASLISPCSTCFVFWAQWECRDETTKFDLDACGHYNDYIMYNGNCLLNPSPSPSIPDNSPVVSAPSPVVTSPSISPDNSPVISAPSPKVASPSPTFRRAPPPIYDTPSPPPPLDNNDTTLLGVGAVLVFAWYYILAICLGGVILIACVIAIFCCCCKTICCC